MNKRIIDDVNDNVSQAVVDNEKPVERKALRLRPIPVALSFLMGILIVSGIGFITSDPVEAPPVSSSVASEPDESILTTPQPTETLETTSNTVSESVVYIEFLDKVLDAQPVSTPETSENSYTVGNQVFSINTFEPFPESEQIWQSGTVLMMIGSVDTHSDLLQQVISSYTSQLSYPEQVQPYADIFAGDRMNYSLDNLNMYNYQQTIQVGSISLYESMLVIGDQFVSFIDTQQMPTELTEDVRSQISNTLSTQSPLYQVLGVPVTKYISYAGNKFLVPSSASNLMDMGAYAYVDLGEELSNNRLYMLTIPEEKLSSIDTSVNTILSLEGLYPDDTRATLTTEVTATWLYRYAKYVELAHGASRIPCYVFPNSITGEYTVFFVAERDNKFPYLLRYLNTMALELI